MADNRRTCPRPKGCGRQFTPRRGTRRVYCYVCRPEKVTGGPGSMPTPSRPSGDGEIAAAVRAELDRVGKASTVAGTVAVRLAVALDDPSLGAAQVAPMSAKLVALMEPLTAAGPREPDELDEFTAALRAKRASA